MGRSRYVSGGFSSSSVVSRLGGYKYEDGNGRKADFGRCVRCIDNVSFVGPIRLRTGLDWTGAFAGARCI